MKKTIMRMFLNFLLVLLLSVLTTVVSQDQSGFISIDCGLPEHMSYADTSTGIYYKSDAEYIIDTTDRGVSNKTKTISSAENKINHQQQLTYVRSFPKGVRNCYRIKVANGTNYLIRASFYYGNYDDLSVSPQFDLHFGANFWGTVKFPNASFPTIKEIFYTPPLNYIQSCLVNTGNGTPFISTIELRPFNNHSYDADSVLSLFRRFDIGSITNLVYRYKDDVHDRIWKPKVFSSSTPLNTSLNNDALLLQNPYKLPAIVMSTAATPVNVSAPLLFNWDADDVNDQYIVYLHFNEVEELVSNETREFNITVNGDFMYGPVTPVYQLTTTILSKRPLTGAARYLISIFKTENSILPPILNAVEIYKLKGFSQSATKQDDVDAITNIKNVYGVTRNWQGDPCAPVNYIWEGLKCSVDNQNLSSIISLNLSSSGLTGQIALSISKLTMLQSLDLSNNSLSGPLPNFLMQMQTLKILNLRKNNLTGVVPSGLLERSKEGSLSLCLDQNLNHRETASCNQNTDDPKKKKNNIIIPIVASFSAILVLLVSAAAIISRLKKRKPQAVDNHVQSNTPNESQLESKQRQHELHLESRQRQYTYDEVDVITNNLNRILGRGGFGTVYYGLIDDTEVAVKMLSKSSVQGYQQFLAEVKLLMRVHHKNLTSLIGYCNEGNNIGLIYEYMANGNLDELLSGKNSRAKFLTWEDRLRIAVDAAQGLEYLHNGCKPPIVHRDVKSTNILLNESFQAKLADFGLSKNFPTDGGSHLSTIVAGTLGYLDHEYMASNRLTEKSDVYSFGVVLLEIITSQPAIIKSPDKTHISQWVRSMLYNGDINNIVDSKLQQNFDTNSAWKAVEIAMACVSLNSSDRPNMNEVVNELKECLAAELARKRTGRRKTKKEGSIESIPLNLTIELSPQAR